MVDPEEKVRKEKEEEKEEKDEEEEAEEQKRKAKRPGKVRFSGWLVSDFWVMNCFGKQQV